MMGPIQISSLDVIHSAFACEVSPSLPAPPSDVSHTPHLRTTAHIPLIEVSAVPAAAGISPGPLHHICMRVAREVPQEHQLATVIPAVQLRDVSNSIVANPAPPVIPPHVPVSKHHPHHVCLPVVIRWPSIWMTSCPSHPSHTTSVGCHSKAAVSSLSCDMVTLVEVVLPSWAACQPSIVATEIIEPNIPGISEDAGAKPASVPGIPDIKPVVVLEPVIREVTFHIVICWDIKISSVPRYAAVAPCCGFCQI